MVQIEQLQPRGPFQGQPMLANGVSWLWVSTSWTTINVCPGCLLVRSVMVRGGAEGHVGKGGYCSGCGHRFSDDGLIEGVVARFVYSPDRWWPWSIFRGRWEVSRQTAPLILDHDESDYLPRFSPPVGSGSLVKRRK